MIIDEKCFHLPPPPYQQPSSSSGSGRGLTLSSLPPHLLLHVVFCTFPQQDGFDSKDELQRQNLLWLHSTLRFVNKALYLACMNVLRSAYLPAYDYNIRVPYSSDPYNSSSRELHTLDLFIALLAHEDVLIDASALHLPREEAYKDLFDIMQPKSRLEDLVAEQGVKYGVISVEGDLPSPPPTPTYSPRMSKLSKSEYPTSSNSSPYTFSPPPSTTSITFTRPPTMLLTAATTKAKSSFFSSLLPKSFKSKSKARADHVVPPSPVSPSPKHIHPLPFSSLSVSFSPRKIGLVYTPPTPSRSASALTLSRPGPSTGRKYTVVEVTRTKEDSLELTARRLVKQLKLWLEQGAADY